MNKEPWLLPYTPWKTRAAFYSYIRGGLRKAVWSRHPVKLEFMKSQRFKAPIGVKGKDVWAYKCDICKEIYRQPDIEVDHIVPAGSLRSEEDLQGFISRLSFVSYEDLRILDKKCHGIITLADSRGMTFNRAAIEKQAIAFNKDKPKFKDNLLNELGVEYTPSTRREAYTRYLCDKEGIEY